MERIGRRHVLAGAAMFGAAALAGCARRQGGGAGRQLGVQLYTVAADLDRDMAGTLARIRTAGIRTVETAGLHGRTAGELRAAFDRAGLHCTSAHVGAAELGGDLDVLARDLHALGARSVVLPSPLLPGKPDGLAAVRATVAALTVDDWRRTADFLNAQARALAGRELLLGYHNHAFDFAPLGDDTGLGVLLRETDPAMVHFELDAGWAVAAGLDPAALLRSHPGRFTQMHVKDVPPRSAPDYGVGQPATDLGKGGTDWARLLPLARSLGVRDFFIEQEPPFTGTATQAVERAAAYLRALRV